MDLAELSKGPIGGFTRPLLGGEPNATDCGNCVDCCHLPEIAVTDDEAAVLARKHEELSIRRRLVLKPDHRHVGWLRMQGPCVFLSEGAAGPRGCRIYEDRPGSCRIFTCALRLALAREI